jgi:hypothetical protein
MKYRITEAFIDLNAWMKNHRLTQQSSVIE